MATPYSQDLRDRVLAAYENGMRTKEISTVFTVSPAWARRVKQRHHESGETSPRRMGRRVGSYKIDRIRLSELVQQRPDGTLAELREELGVACAISTISMILNKLGFSFKKRRSMLRNRIEPMSKKSECHGARSRTQSMPGI